MPEVTLNIPKNSLFHSSLNEIDLAYKEVMLNQMRIADPRNALGKQNITADPSKDDWLWDRSRVFQVDELTTEEIFDTFLLRKKINNKKGVDVTYPILAFKQNDIDTVFWGSGNRYRQWFLETTNHSDDWEIGDEVAILKPFKYRGLKGTIATIKEKSGVQFFTIDVNGTELTTRKENLKIVPMEFTKESLRHTNAKAPQTYKAKAITCTYDTVILVDNRDEAQYIRDSFIMNCADAQIWHKYSSPTINGSENQIFTVFGIPNLERYPVSKDKIKGEGFIYGVGFQTNIWGCLTNKPLPTGFIDMVRMNIHVEGDGRSNRIVITE